MGQFSVDSIGDYSKTLAFLKKLSKGDLFKQLDAYGRQGVALLASATPVDSRLTASSWGYVVSESKGKYSISWTNSHVVDGTPVAILLQYGHGTGSGGYVSGRDYINPALRPLFDKLVDKVWKAVISA